MKSGTITSGMGGTISPEWVALYHRNEWHCITGMGGTVSPEWVAQLPPEYAK